MAENKISTDIMSIKQMDSLLSRVVEVEKDNIFGFDQLHPVMKAHLFDALSQGIIWGKELEELKKAE
jgi:hypothetical protein